MSATDLHAALARAAVESRTKRCNMHVFHDGTSFVVTEYMPARPQRTEWLRVRVDGVVEVGGSRKKLGTLKELGL